MLINPPPLLQTCVEAAGMSYAQNLVRRLMRFITTYKHTRVVYIFRMLYHITTVARVQGILYLRRYDNTLKMAHVENYT